MTQGISLCSWLSLRWRGFTIEWKRLKFKMILSFRTEFSESRFFSALVKRSKGNQNYKLSLENREIFLLKYLKEDWKYLIRSLPLPCSSWWNFIETSVLVVVGASGSRYCVKILVHYFPSELFYKVLTKEFAGIAERHTPCKEVLWSTIMSMRILVFPKFVLLQSPQK